ncbi:hypothetical protein OJ997_09605 [Solirubrobacter phytolaccae]|uniref:Uncharacterized protein n=1 Tax=Solirubrobacter phytolaccae TaxID=1404360 RepID=A0A9X3N6D9_9ACTN|nr:hypothetical protein [Solirubrobacter phytolaccae]MDA0180548.1 hypothetical protein [Solirubrobacter phytolaccae]
MELIPARESRTWTLLMFGAAALVGLPLMVWRAHVDDELGEAAEVFALATATGLLIVAAWSVWRTRWTLRRAKPAPADAHVVARKTSWRAAFVAFGVVGGFAPFLRSGFEESSAVFAAFGYGLCLGASLAIAYGLWYLRRAERRKGLELFVGNRQYYVQ